MTDTAQRDDRPATIVATCPKCGRTWRPTRRQVAEGSWDRCPHCEPDDLEAS